MIEYSSYALAVLLTALVNPHPNISLIPDALNHNSYACDLPILPENAWHKFYDTAHNYNLRYTLHKEAKNLNENVINKAVTALSCAEKYHVKHAPILTVIDYSLPSNQKRLWIFDLANGKLLYNTYVGHGITSGALMTEYFSNRNNSKASSIGIYITEKAYVGREGMSMRLNGIDSKFNNNAANRYIVMHGGWYMDDNFIKQYGRSGRSWGCPALPSNLTSEIINTIKDGTLVVMYYPSERWFQESKFLNCETPKSKTAEKITESLEPIDASREHVLFAPLGKEKAIMVMSSQKYSDSFHKTPPLERMLRRRIGHEEYIALSTDELEKLIYLDKNHEYINQLKFANATVRNHRGYWITEMVFATEDKVDSIKIRYKEDLKTKFKIKFASGKTLGLTVSNDFIRWLGL